MATNFRANFPDLILEDALPAIRAVAVAEYKARPALHPIVFQVLTSSRAIEQFTQVTGIGLAAEIAEGAAVTYDQPMQGFDKTFKHKKYGTGFKATQELIEDEQWGLIRKTSRNMPIAVRETMEIDVWSVLNNAFDGTNYAGPDGKALCATDHPLIKAGGTQTNKGTAADLDFTSLRLAMVDFELMKAANGHQINLSPKRLIVHPSNRIQAYELTKSAMRPDTANNVTNAMEYVEGGMPDVLVVPKLTDDDAWFLAAAPEDTGLKVFMRRRPYIKQWVEDETETACTAIRYRMSYGWDDFYGFWGNPGV